MTISAVVPDIAFVGTSSPGTLGPFSLVKNGTAIVYYNNSDIYVYRYSSVTDETPLLLVEGVDYTLTGSPGSITLTSPQTGLLTAQRLYVVRRQTLAQSLDLVNGGNFSSSNLERRLDIIEAKFQEQAREIKSAVRFAMFDTDEIPGTVPLARAIDRLPYISGTAANPILEFINVNELGATANLTESQLADIAVVVADLTGADTIGIVATAFDTIGVDALQDVAENIGDVELVATALAAGGLAVTKDTYAALTAIPAASRSNNTLVYVAGRAAVGDGGDGTWRFSSTSVAAANGGTILAPDAGTGRWLRQYTGPVLTSWFGTNGAAIISAVATGAKHVLIAPGFYTLLGIVTLSAYQTLQAVGGVASVGISKGFNGDMFNMSADGCELRGINVLGAGATFTGRGAIVGGGIDQVIDNCFITDTAGFALEFTAADAGQRFKANDSQFRCTTVANAAIGLPTATETAGNRYFINCQAAGGTLLRFNSGLNTQIIGGGFANLDFAGSSGISLRAIISSARIAPSGGTVTIFGQDVNVLGCLIAGDIVLDAGTQRCKISANGMLTGATVTDNSTATGQNVNEIWDAYYSPTIKWKGDSTDPVLGNGTLTCRVYRSGRRLKVDVALVVGSTTTFGTGAWYFELPAPFATWTARAAVVGAAVMLDSGTQRFIGAAQINAGSRRVYIGLDASPSQVNPAAPMTWAVSDTLSFSIEYEIN